MSLLPAVTVEIGEGSTMFTGSPSWTDISAYVRRLSTRRGRPSLTGRFSTGTASLVVDNRDGRFNPANTSGAYYPNLLTGMPVRITHTVGMTTYSVFYGSVRAFKPAYAKGNTDSTVTLTAADGFYTLNLEDLENNTYSAESTDSRIGNVLDDLGWPAGLRDLDTGLANVQAVEFAQPYDGGDQPALDHLQDVAESEAGNLFMSADGKVTLRNRVALSGASASVTFTSSDIHGMGEDHDDDFFWNYFRIAREDGATVILDNTSGEPRRVYTRDVMPMNSDAEVLNVAEWLANVYGAQRQRVGPLTLKPLKDTSGSFLASILSLELRDFVTVQHTPPGGDSIDVDCSVEAINHTLVPGDWTTVLELAPLGSFETQSFWVLGTSALDQTARLA